MAGVGDAAVEIRPLAPVDPRVQRLVGELDQLQTSLYPAESNHLDPIEVLESPEVTFLAAFVGDEVIGCGAAKRMPGRYGEIKRVYVDSAARGRGVGRAIMEALEADLLAHGINFARLETGVCQPEALALYEHCGYVRISPFGDYREDPLSIFLEKRLA